MKSILAFTVVALWLTPPAAVQAATTTPQIFWASDPVRPGETVLLIGEGLSTEAVVEIAQVERTEPAAPSWTTVKPLQAGPRSAKAVVPADWKMGLFACRVRIGDAVSNQLLVNAPDPWWWQGDGGQTASPGGRLRVFGKSLNFGGQSQASLRAADGASVPLATREASGCALTFSVPKDLAPGDYSLSVHNGLAGDAAGRAAGTVSVRPPAVWKDDQFNVKDFGPNPGEALLAALKKAEANGGGIVYLPRGRYPVKDTLTVPPNTVLKGEAMELVSLYWPDFDDLFIGNTFEDGGAFQLYSAAHDSIVAENKGARMDGFLVWGLNPHGWGQQPSWFCQFLDNEIVEGNGYGHRAASFGTTGRDDPQLYDGPMLRGIVFRRNVIHNNGSIQLGGKLEAALVEHCVVRDADVGIKVAPSAQDVLLRGNRFENVAQPLVGEGIANAE